MAQKTALVTGGTGTIGSEICRQLTQAGCQVVATCLPAEEGTLAEDEQIAFNAGSHSELIRLTYADYERLVHPTPLTN